jgi:hypothetical protein
MVHPQNPPNPQNGFSHVTVGPPWRDATVPVRKRIRQMPSRDATVPVRKASTRKMPSRSAAPGHNVGLVSGRPGPNPTDPRHAFQHPPRRSPSIW